MRRNRGAIQLVGAEPALAEARLLARARDAGIPIFHVMHDAGPGTPYDIRTEIGQISDPVRPQAGEPVIVKAYQTRSGRPISIAGCGRWEYRVWFCAAS